MSQKYPDNAYLTVQLFEDRDVDIRCSSRRLVTTRQPHRCAYADVICDPHQIPPGTRAICERAIVEGQWGAWYACLACVDTWLDHIKWNA